MDVSIVVRFFRWTKAHIVGSYAFRRINWAYRLILRAWFTCFIECNSWFIRRARYFDASVIGIVNLFIKSACLAFFGCLIQIASLIEITNFASGHSIQIH
jgi:hypothetical protein